MHRLLLVSPRQKEWQRDSEEERKNVRDEDTTKINPLKKTRSDFRSARSNTPWLQLLPTPTPRSPQAVKQLQLSHKLLLLHHSGVRRGGRGETGRSTRWKGKEELLKRLTENP